MSGLTSDQAGEGEGAAVAARPEPGTIDFGQPDCHRTVLAMFGRTVSHYRVLSELGSGGMGVVYRAEDLLLGREVALKFLPPGLLADHDALERFRREARLSSALNHPGICTVHDVDEDHGPPFIVMELVEGSALTSFVQQGPMAPRRVAEIGMEMLDALGAAHQRGIIHRDIKPANIFVTPSGRVKVLDFGLAKTAPLAVTRDAPDGDETATRGGINEATLTSPGLQVGTFAYMSPEQARGEPLDARTDLFSCGAVLYEIATGQRAFRGESVALVCDQVLNRRPTPPRALNPEIPEVLEAIIDRALAKRPEQRYQSADEMAADLRRLIGPGEVAPLQLAAVSTPRPRWRWRAAARCRTGAGGRSGDDDGHARQGLGATHRPRFDRRGQLHEHDRREGVRRNVEPGAQRPAVAIPLSGDRARPPDSRDPAANGSQRHDAGRRRHSPATSASAAM